MIPSSQPPEPAPASPTWRELAAFIDEQSRNDRDLFDRWFKRTAWLLGIVSVVGGALIGFFGWKTASDARTVAENTARDEAKAKVAEVLSEPGVQKLVRETASQLLAKGEFHDAVVSGLRDQISNEIASAHSRELIAGAIRAELKTTLAWRTLTAAQSSLIADSLRTAPAGRVSVRAGAVGEPQNYARKLYQAINASPAWKDHLSFTAPGTWSGLTAAGDEITESLAEPGGIAIVVGNPSRPPESARQLAAALKSAGIGGVRVASCQCSSAPRPNDIFVYVFDKVY